LRHPSLHAVEILVPLRSRVSSGLVVLALAFGGVVIVAAPASAASFTVTDPADTNTPGTLRYALGNLTPGALNTITIGALGTITAATALPSITASVTITGPGESALTIDSSAGDVLTVTGGVPDIAVSISGLTLSSADPLACAILASNANLTVTSVTANGFGCSGAITTSAGALTATDVTVMNNATALRFSGSDASDTLTLTRIRADGSTFRGIVAIVVGAMATVTSVDADDVGGYGVDISTTTGGSLTVSDVHVARSGTSGITLTAGTGSSVEITDSSASDGREGIRLDAGAGSTISAARLTSTGNAMTGIWLNSIQSSSLSLQSSLVRDTAATSGIFVNRVDHATLTLSDLQVLDNTSNFGGGIYLGQITNGATATIAGSTISGNTSTDDGGGIHLGFLADDDTSLTITDSIISGNTSADYGGGLYLLDVGAGATSTAHVVVQRTTFDSNYGGGYGAAIAINEPGSGTAALPTVLIDSSTVSNNTTPAGGGGVYIGRSVIGAAAVVTILNTTISGNDAQLGGGVEAEAARRGTGGGGHGGPYVAGPDLLTTVISHSTIAGNSAHTSAGVAANPGDHRLEIDNSILAGGTSNNGGTADDLDPSPTFSLAYSLVEAPLSGTATPAGVGNITGVDPKLGLLANNGGTTLTRLVSPGSPAYNSGDPAFAGAGLLDQRGQARVYQVVDMGAVEWQPALAHTGVEVTPGPPLIALLLLFAGTAMVAFSRLRTARSLV
jgi:hypothetical protein